MKKKLRSFFCPEEALDTYNYSEYSEYVFTSTKRTSNIGSKENVKIRKLVYFFVKPLNSQRIP